MKPATEEGRKLNDFVTAARQFTHDLSSLLQTADSFMASNGWTAAAGTYCNEGVSANVHIPSGWFPKDLLRFYESDIGGSNVLAAISITLLRRPDAVREFDEPLLSAIWFDFGTEAPGQKNAGWEFWYGWWHMYFPAVECGTWAEHRVADLPEADRAKNHYRFSRARNMSQPLAQVTTTETLAKLIVQPLLADVGTHAKSTESNKA